MGAVKDYLRSYLQSKRRYQSILLDIEELETQIQGLSIDYTKEKVKSSPNYDRLASVIDRLNKLREASITALDECTANMESVIASINRVENGTLHEILTRKYVKGQAWEYIAIEMGYDLRYIFKLHSKALEEVRKQ